MKAIIHAIRLTIIHTLGFFGKPFDKEVQKQPWIMILLRKPLEEVRNEAKANGFDPELITHDNDVALAADLTDDGRPSTQFATIQTISLSGVRFTARREAKSR